MPRWSLLLSLTLIFLSAVNLLGALLPERGFDALWYHLTIPKLYLTSGSPYHIPGGLLYYSELPRLVEFIYLGILTLGGNEVTIHLLNWSFGLGVALILYTLSRRFVGRAHSLLAVIVFYSTQMVSWQSGSSYVDLARTFFELLALHFLLGHRYLLTGLSLGLAASTKLLAVGSLPALLVIALLRGKRLSTLLQILFSFTLVMLPWILSGFLNTGYPAYPIGTGILSSDLRLFPSGLNPINLLRDFWLLNNFSSDPIGPLYLIVAPLILISLPQLIRRGASPLIVYTIFTYLSWWAIPHSGGGRFIMSYLPVWAILTVLTFHLLRGYYRALVLFALGIVVAVNFLVRSAATARGIPYLQGGQTRQAFLCRNLDFKTSVFFDCDDWFKMNIKNTDRVLVSGSHNLFYIDFPFVHESWYNGEEFNYWLIQNDTLTKSFLRLGTVARKKLNTGHWAVVYQNKKTGLIVVSKINDE